MRINELKIEASKDINDAVCRIGLSDGSLFSFRNCYLPPEIIETHLIIFSQNKQSLPDADKTAAEITAFEEAAFRHASACLRAEKNALRLIARAEQCCGGLKRKLEKRGHDTACINAVIERLCSLSLLDDSRFARLWLESRLRITRSPRQLLSSLCSRGIDRDDAQTALKNVLDDEAEYALLLRFVNKYKKKVRRKIIDESDVRRSIKYLLKSEGFSHTAIMRFLEEG